MQNEQNLTIQSYEKKIITTLRDEKYSLNSLKRNKDFLDHVVVIPTSSINLANKFYKDQINKTIENYNNSFSDILMPLVLEKGLSFEAPEDELTECMNIYDYKVLKIIEKIQIINKIHDEPFFDKNLVHESWGLSLDGIDDLPFMIALGCNRMIVLDENFNLNLHFFASLGAMPDIRPISKAGNVDMPPDSYNIVLQIMLGTEFKQVSILLIKQKMQNLDKFFSFMVNIGLVVDTKSNIEDDFSGLKWIKNSLKHSLFKKKDFLNIAKTMKVGGIVIDKSVSPMQTQKIQSLNMNNNVNLNIGFEINKLGTLQYSIVKKTDNINIVYDSFEDLICKIPDFNNKGTNSNKFSTF
ncbi:MAG: hypothetical protein U0354_01515 [Candidatus Sericytochromatia bacterium]